MNIREIKVSDAENFLTLSKKLDQETSFMLYEPNERKTNVEQQTKALQRILESESSTIFVAEDTNESLIGFLAVIGGNVQRKLHTAYLAIGILQDYARQGIGNRLFDVMEEWATNKEIHRLELTVMTHNEAGIALYKKRGFFIEGTKKHSLKINGQYVDEYYMAKLL
ncbi:GNAT family N-acetyltransferase [Bacillus timonensis]|nr:GNAT family N-acetyltransferase [Bacillus timonensis]